MSCAWCLVTALYARVIYTMDWQAEVCNSIRWMWWWCVEDNDDPKILIIMVVVVMLIFNFHLLIYFGGLLAVYNMKLFVCLFVCLFIYLFICLFIFLCRICDMPFLMVSQMIISGV